MASSLVVAADGLFGGQMRDDGRKSLSGS